MRIILAALAVLFLTVQAEAKGVSSEVIGGRPSGCPHRYCGCASARYVGLVAKWNANLARNWLVYLPAAAPGPGMADATRGHVRIIIGSAGNGLWRFYDPNSGRGLTRIVVDAIRGRVVNPGGTVSTTQYAAVRYKEPRRGRRGPPRLHQSPAPTVQFAQVY